MTTFYGIFERYNVDNEERIIYFKNEDGLDWYDLVRVMCQHNDNGKLLSTSFGDQFILVNPETNDISSWSMDLSSLAPDGFAVYSIDPNIEITWGKHFVDGEVIDPPYVATVPNQITMRQAKLMLSRVGLLSQANEIIESIPEPEGEEARIEWQYASVLERDHPLVLQLSDALELPDAQIDQLFIWANEL
jgi:hypothetical protein